MLEICSHCDGSGWEVQFRKGCLNCGGTGKIAVTPPNTTTPQPTETTGQCFGRIRDEIIANDKPQPAEGKYSFDVLKDGPLYRVVIYKDRKQWLLATFAYFQEAHAKAQQIIDALNRVEALNEENESLRREIEYLRGSLD